MNELWSAIGISFQMLGISCLCSAIWIGRNQKQHIRKAKKDKRKHNCEDTVVLTQRREDQSWKKTKES